MALNEVIRTSGDIRRYLAQTMVQVGNGDMAVDRGLGIAALAKEITSSMQAEVNVAKVKISMLAAGADLGKTTKLGHLLIEQDGSTPTLSGQ
jgi:hypothetical protein